MYRAWQADLSERYLRGTPREAEEASRRKDARIESLVDCRRWCLLANGIGRCVRVERLSDSPDQGVRLDYFRSHPDILNQLVFSGMQCVSGWPVDETHWSESCRHSGGSVMGWRSFSRQFFSAQTLVAVSHLWSHRRNRPRHGIYRSDHGPGEVVPRPPGTNHRHRGGRVRRGIIVFSPCRRLVDPACGIDADVCISGSGLRRHRYRCGLVHAKSIGRLDARGLDSVRKTYLATM